MAYGERGLLPAIPGVYCLLTERNLILYIGQSENICQRWKGHHLKTKLRAGASLRIAWRETFSESGRLKLEALLIRRHQPRLNVNLLPRPLPTPKVVLADVLSSPAMGNRMLNAKQIAERFGVSNSTARGWLLRGLLPGAELRESELGVSYWVAPESSLKDFVPPKRGPVPKPTAEAQPKPAKRRGRKAA